jgi:hypothetical protein
LFKDINGMNGKSLVKWVNRKLWKPMYKFSIRKHLTGILNLSFEFV